MKRRGSWGGLIVILLLCSPFVGTSLYLDAAGVTVPGTVTDKRESIGVRYGRWSRRLEIAVRYQPLDQSTPIPTGIGVDAATYDRLHTGDQVTVRYAPNRLLRDLVILPAARLEGQTTLSWLRLGVNTPSGIIVTLALIGIALLVVWRLSRLKIVGLALFVYVIGVIAYFIVPASTPALAGPLQTSTATVRRVHVVTRLGRGRRNIAAQPFDIVELNFIPQGMRDPVVAVDSVDDGSLPGLKQGDTVSISYEVGDPRQAQINGGTRGSGLANILGYGVGIALLLVLAVGGFLLRSLFGRLTVPFRARAEQRRRQAEEKRRQDQP
jgi:hypothetical protein